MTDRDHKGTIAGYRASWQRFDLCVEEDLGSSAVRTLDCPPVELYALSAPEECIDSAALLREREIADPPYWALVWTGARAIAAAVAEWDFAPSTRVLDLGCGLGLSGLAAAAKGAAVTFGDYLEEPLEFVRATLKQQPRSFCDVVRVDFTKNDHCGGPYDLILAADVVYDPSHYVSLASFLDRHLARGGTILLTESLRADARVFLAGMQTIGFRDETAAMWVMEDGRRERTWLHRLRR